MAHPSKAQLDQEAKELLQTYASKELKPRDRLAIPPQEMPTQLPNQRVKNMEEVATGYTESQVQLESLRCLQCANAPCIKGCPVSIDIPRFIAKAAEGDYAGSVAVIKESSMLPAI